MGNMNLFSEMGVQNLSLVCGDPLVRWQSTCPTHLIGRTSTGNTASDPANTTSSRLSSPKRRYTKEISRLVHTIPQGGFTVIRKVRAKVRVVPLSLGIFTLYRYPLTFILLSYPFRSTTTTPVWSITFVGANCRQITFQTNRPVWLNLCNVCKVRVNLI